MRGAFETDESFCIGRGNSPSSPSLAFGVEMYLFHFSIAHRKLRLPIVRQTPPNASMLALIWSPYHSFNFKNRHKNSSRLLFQFGRLWDGTPIIVRVRVVTHDSTNWAKASRRTECLDSRGDGGGRRGCVLRDRVIHISSC